MSRIQLPIKQVGESSKAVFDFISRLAVTETILTASVVATVYSGVDALPSSIISGAATISGTKVTQLLTAGVAGTIYQLICTITTSAGQTLSLPAFLAVESGLI